MTGQVAFLNHNNAGHLRRVIKIPNSVLYFSSYQIDISNQEQMATFKEQLQSLPSVAGIVITAMVLRDEYVKDFTFEAFTESMDPKIKGKIP